MEYILYKTLQEIKKQPGFYFGNPSLKKLSLFIFGYNVCYFDLHGKVCFDIFPSFQDFIKNYYKGSTFQNWVDIIVFFSGNDREAFYKFYELLDEFLENDPTFQKCKEDQQDDRK